MQIQAKVQAHATVYIHSAYLSDADLRSVHLLASPDIAATVDDALARAGPQAWVCVLPEGPQTIPYLDPRA